MQSRIRGALSLLTTAAVISGCSSSLPDGNAQWAGQAISVVSSANTVRFAFACTAATFAGSIEANRASSFTFSGVDTVYFGPLRDTLPGNSGGLVVQPIRVTGSTAGDQLSVDVTYTAEPGSTAQHFDLTRNRAGDFSHTVCPL